MGYTHKQRFNKKYNFDLNEKHSLKEISEITNIKKYILQKVYNRGIGAYSNLSSVRLKGSFKKNPDIKKYPASKRLTKQQWAYARVYSFVMGGKTQKTTDSDLWDKHLKNK